MRMWRAAAVLGACAVLVGLLVPRGLAAPAANALRVALAGFEEDNFDPKFTGGTTLMRISVPIYDYVTWLNPNFGVVPGLARSWDVSPDGRVYTFHLRPGLRYHNGDPVTAQDVVFSYNRLMEKDSKNTVAGTLRGIIESIEAPNPATAVFHLRRPEADFLLDASPYEGGSPILPAPYFAKVGADGFSRNPVGGGPWKLVAHDPGSRIEYEAVPNSWRPKPAFQRLVLVNVPEESTRIAMLQRGEADIAEIGLVHAAELKTQQIRVTSVPRAMQFGVFYYGYWTDPKGPMADLRVRKALAYGVNYGAIIRGVLLNQGERSLPWGVFPGSTYADPSRPSQKPYPYDAAKARALLQEAGYARGFDLKLYSLPFSGSPFLPQVAELIADNWRQIGVRPQILPVDFGVFRMMYRGRDPRLMGTATVFRYPAVLDAGFNCQDQGVIRTNGSQPINNSPKIDQLCEDAMKEWIPNQRAEAMKKVFDAVDQEFFFGFTIAYANAVYASNPRTVGDWTPINSYLDLGPVYERIPAAK